jgi:hypothetical protein
LIPVRTTSWSSTIITLIIFDRSLDEAQSIESDDY